MAGVDKAIVFSLRYGDSAGIDGDDEVTARAVQKYPGKFVGFAAVDPRRADCMDLLRKAVEDYGLKVETLAPAAAVIIPGQGIAILGLKTLSELLIGENPLDVEALWDKLYVGSAYYGRRGVAMHRISAIDNCLWSIRAEAAGDVVGAAAGRAPA